MSWITNLFKKQEVLTEALPSFKNKGASAISDKQLKNRSGEGVTSFISGYGKESLTSFNNFYGSYINTAHANEREKIMNYRMMAQMPEIASVIEDIIIESTGEDEDGKILTFKILDTEYQNNENIQNNLTDQFVDLFYKKLKINDSIWDFIKTYYIDGKVFIEKIIQKSKPSNGIINLKKLPTETMDFDIDPITGKINVFYQYLKPNAKRPKSMEDAEKDENVIVFFPEQIIFLDYGLYGSSKEEIFGYLEKVKQPFNQLKLLETSVVIYRLVKSPERLVFRIDTGAMPKDKAMAFVEKVKQKFLQKISYDQKKGTLVNEPNVISMLDNYFLPQCLRLNTEISCLDGDKTLSQMINDYNNGITNEVLSIDQKTGKLIHGEVEWAGVTRKNADLVRVHLDNGESVDVTPDHKFVMRDGTEMQAQHLNKDDSLMPFYTRNEKICSSSNEYQQVYDISNDEWLFTHRIVKPISKGNVVHHKDFNRFNNLSTNLVEMDNIYHFIYHSMISGGRLKEMWKDDKYRTMMTDTARKTANRRWSSDKERNCQSLKMKQYWKDNYNTFYDNVSKPKSDSHKKSLSISISNKWKDDKYRQKVSKGSKDRWKNDDFKKHMSTIQKCVVDSKTKSRFIKLFIDNDKPTLDRFRTILSNDTIFMDNWYAINKEKKNVKKDFLGKTSFRNIVKSLGYNTFISFKENVIVNHKVDFVEVLSVKDDTGCLTIKDVGNNHNFPLSIGVYVKNSSDGRGSSIESIGGNPSGFAEIDDIWYFNRKLYTALKYPMSRVMNMQEGRQGDTMFMGGQTGEISRDEIRWAKFLERHQNKFEQAFTELFLLHLEFQGLKKEYDIDNGKINILMTPPNNYKQQMQQMLLESQMNNYQTLANNSEFSKGYLQRKYLKWDDEEVELNAKYHKEDEELVPKDEY